MGKITVISRHPEKAIYMNRVTTYTRKAIEQMQLPVEELTLVFVDNAAIQALHAQYLNEDTPTDIMTFPLHEPNAPIEADIVISIDMAIENARHFQVSPEEELRRLVIYGLLHLSGLKDASQEEQQIMREQENFWLFRLPFGALFLKNSAGK